MGAGGLRDRRCRLAERSSAGRHLPSGRFGIAVRDEHDDAETAGEFDGSSTNVYRAVVAYSHSDDARGDFDDGTANGYHGRNIDRAANGYRRAANGDQRAADRHNCPAWLRRRRRRAAMPGLGA